MNPAPRRNAFTLLEILLVVAAVGILAAIVIVAINPQRQLEKTRDAERQSEVNTLYDAIQQYNIDNNGYPSPVANLSDHEAAEICQDGTSDPSCINLTNELVETYLAEIPSDPQASGAGSGYVVAKNGSRIRLEAVSAEVENDLVTAGYTSTRLLDGHPFATAAYSVRLLNASHEVETAQSGNSSAGSYLVRIRQNNTNDDTADVLPDSNGELSANSEVYNTTNSSDGQTLGTWVGANNAYVTTWYDQSGNEHNASQGTLTQQPQIYDGSSVITENSKPALDFDGSDDYVKYPTINVTGPSNDWTVTAEFSINSTSSSKYFIWHPRAEYDYSLYKGGGGEIKFFSFNNSLNTLSSGVTTSTDTLYRTSASNDGSGNYKIHVNGSLEDQASLPDPDPISSYNDIGSQSHFDRNYLDGTITALIIHDKTFSDSEVLDIHNILSP